MLKKLKNPLPWTVGGVLIAIAFGVAGLYTGFHERRPDLAIEIVNEANVLDIHQPAVEGL